MTRAMQRWSFRLLALLAVPGCAVASSPIDAPAPLFGNYRIVAVDGRAPEFVQDDGGQPRTPYFGFGERSYGGTSGCNFMGGLKAERGGRLYTYPGAQTQMACGGLLGRQEAAIDAMFRASPTIVRDGEAVFLRGAGRTLRLVRDVGRPAAEDAPEAWQGSSLAGQRFEMHQINGDSLNRRPAPLLSFAARTVTLTHVCRGPVSGLYRQAPGTLRIALKPTRGCDLRRFDGTLSTVSGPNGELLLAGDGHWLAGDNLRRDRPK